MSKQPFSWEKCKKTKPPGLAMLDGKVVTVVGPSSAQKNHYYIVYAGTGHGRIIGEPLYYAELHELSNLPEEPEKPELKPVDVVWFDDGGFVAGRELDDPAYAVRSITVDPNLTTMEEVAEADVDILIASEIFSVFRPWHTEQKRFGFSEYSGKLPALRAAREYATKLVNEARR